MTTKVVAPKLRFKEFQNDWNHRLLGAIYSFKNGVNAEKSQYGSGYKFINVLDIINNDYISYESIIGSVNISAVEFSKNEIKYGDILFQRSSETREDVGQSNVYLDVRPVTFGGFVIRGRAEVEIDPIFSHHLLKTSSVRDQITQRSGGATRYNIGQESLSAIPICTPELPEQTKIANFLTAVDSKVSQLTKKHELLILYKKGVMQKIFNQELRFKDDEGREFPEWKLDALGNLSDVRDGTHESPSFINIGYPLITSKNLLIDGSLDEATVNFICEKDFNNFNKRSKVSVGDILFGMIGTIGNPVQVKSSNFAIKNVALIKETGGLNNSFLTQYLKSPSIIKKLDALKTGNTQKFISLGNLRSMEIASPCSTEQTKIANFLAAIDDKITNVKSQLEAAKEYKQGLLQQMFV